MGILIVTKVYLQTLNPIIFTSDERNCGWYSDTFQYNFHYVIRTKRLNYMNIAKRHKTRPWQRFIKADFHRTLSVLNSPQQITKGTSETQYVQSKQNNFVYSSYYQELLANMTIISLFTRTKRKRPTVIKQLTSGKFFIYVLYKNIHYRDDLGNTVFKITYNWLILKIWIDEYTSGPKVGIHYIVYTI